MASVGCVTVMRSDNMGSCAPLKTVTRKLTLVGCAIGITKTCVSTVTQYHSEIVTQQKDSPSLMLLPIQVAGNGLVALATKVTAKSDGEIRQKKKRIALVTSSMSAQSAKVLLSDTNATTVVASIQSIWNLGLKPTMLRTWRCVTEQNGKLALKAIRSVNQGLSTALTEGFQKGYAVCVPVNALSVGGTRTANATWGALGA